MDSVEQLQQYFDYYLQTLVKILRFLYVVV